MRKRKKKPKTASLKYEREVMARGCANIVGIDEAGRGAWAGPVAAGAVCLPVFNKKLRNILAGVRDSKQMTPPQRERLAERIKEVAVAWGIGSASSVEIDEVGIVPATKLAMQRALEMIDASQLDFEPDCLFLDGMGWDEAPVDCEQVHIVRGDQLSLSIAAASVLAKVWRDDYLRQLDRVYPDYGFAAHKGYGTVKHLAALRQFGASSVHRTCYAPVRAVIEAMSDR